MLFMRARVYIIAAAAAFLAACPAMPVRAGGGGTTAASFLKIPVAAMPTGMGEAYTAMVGPDSILYNPAGLGLMSYSAFSGSHNQYLIGIKQEYLSLAWRFPFGTVAGAFSSLSSGDIDAYDENDMPVGTTSTGHRMMAVSFAKSWPHFRSDEGKLDPMLITPPWTRIEPVTDYRPKVYRVSAGATLKKIDEKLAGETSGTYAFDAGATLILPHHFHVGASAMNFGGSQKFINSSAKLPSSFRFGVAKDFHTVNDIMVFTVASDLVKYTDQDLVGASGLQMDVMRMFQLRLGYTTHKDSGSRMSGGFGMNFDRFSEKGALFNGARVDYSYLDYGSLGTTHRLGVQFIW